jgi:hypothetical protein
MSKAKELINERIRDLKTGEVGLVVSTRTDEATGEELVGYVTVDKEGSPTINWQTVANVVVIIANLWEIIFPIIKDAINFFFGDPSTWKARREARKAIRDAKR